MSLLLRASRMVKRPVVTLDGEDIAQVKDVVYDGSGGEVLGFTLSGRGLLSGPRKDALPWRAVVGCGGDAMVIEDESVLTERDAVVEAQAIGERDVLGSRLVTDSGVDLGVVVDVIVESANTADVVGYEVASSPALGHDQRNVLIPLPDTLSVSGEALMVPAAAVEYVSDDLVGFGAAMRDFRSRLAGES